MRIFRQGPKWKGTANLKFWCWGSRVRSKHKSLEVQMSLENRKPSHVEPHQRTGAAHRWGPHISSGLSAKAAQALRSAGSAELQEPSSGLFPRSKTILLPLPPHPLLLPISTKESIPQLLCNSVCAQRNRSVPREIGVCFLRSLYMKLCKSLELPVESYSHK